MNALVKKEIRLLLPSFLIGLLLAFSVWLIPSGSVTDIRKSFAILPFLCCPVMLVMMTLDSFGHELSAGTFSLLLSQPVPRTRIWRTKTLLLAAASLLIWLVWCVCYFLHNPDQTEPAELRRMFAGFALFVLAGYSGGLWTVLLLRQVAAAFWFTVLIPATLLVIPSNLLENCSANVQFNVPVGVFTIYSIAGFLFARRLFLRAQDMAWTGGAIMVPEVRGLAWFKTGSGARRAWRPWLALFAKEFHLHQSLLPIAGVLALLHLGVIATRKFGNLNGYPDLKFVFEQFWLLWLVMPLFVGCAAVAEERKLGTHERQLCLPTKRRTQFAVKLLVALGLSVFFGAFMPLLLEGIRILPETHFSFGGLETRWQSQMSTAQVFFFNCVERLNIILPLLSLAGMAVFIAAVSFYVSTLTRNTLQALAPAVLCIILAGFLMAAAWTQEFAIHPLWRGWLIYLIGLPVVLPTLLALAFWNFRHVAIGWKLWLWNLLALAMSMAFAIVATTAVYHRAWEKLTSFEPPHGTARLSLSNPVRLGEQWDGMSVRLPDGKIWMNHFMPSSISSSLLAFGLGNFKVAVDKGGFIEGSHWATMKNCLLQLVGIKTDGTLWVSEKPWQGGRFQSGDRKNNEDEMRQLVQFGNETNWSSIAPFELSVWLVKKDGTLWRWGPTVFDSKHNQWPGLRAFTPHRLGTESNWADVFRNGYEAYLRKTDGSIWAMNDNSWNTNSGAPLKIDRGLTVQFVAGSEHGTFRSMAEVWRRLCYHVGIRDDGTFRIWAGQHLNRSLHYGNLEWSATDLPIGNGTNWVAVASSGRKAVTLKDDGSLWLWDFQIDFWYLDPDRDGRELQNTIPICLGTHSDWIAIASGEEFGIGGGNIISLAADGSLWYWPLQRSGYYYSDGGQFEPLLDIPRKPQFLGNVFSKVD